MRTTCGLIVTALAVAYVTVPVVAHHGFDTEYDSAKTITGTGVVSKVERTNPHMHVYVDVTDAGGKVKTYNLELTSPNAIQRQGGNKNDPHAGQRGRLKGN